MRTNYFSQLHPGVCCCFFLYAVTFSILFNHPIMMATSCLAALFCAGSMSGWKTLGISVLFTIPTIVIFAVVNPFFNHQGTTPLFYWNDQPITLESTLYGLCSGVMIISMIMWFICFQKTVENHKLLYLFGKVIPTIALMVTMILRFIPYFKRKLDQIAATQRMFGVSTSSGSIKNRLKAGGSILSVLFSISMEGTVGTSDSMRARGYGLKGKTHYKSFCMKPRDWFFLGVLCGASAFLIWAFYAKQFQFYFFPAMTDWRLNPIQLGICIFHCIILCSPLLYNGWEGLRWHRIQVTA